jgi:hypothetical protein
MRTESIRGFRSNLVWFGDRQAAFATLVNDSDVTPQEIEMDLVGIVLN